MKPLFQEGVPEKVYQMIDSGDVEATNLALTIVKNTWPYLMTVQYGYKSHARWHWYNNKKKAYTKARKNLPVYQKITVGCAPKFAQFIKKL